MSSVSTADRELVITRTFEAPCELVWLAMTDPRHVVEWWGPRGFTTTIQEMNLVPGGVWDHVMHGPDGTDYPNHSIFREIAPPHRLVFDNAGGAEGGPHVDFESTWTFEPLGAGRKTKVIIRMLFPTKAKRDTVVEFYGALEGGEQTLERLSEHLPKMAESYREVTIVRTIDAPRALVFQAWLDPEQLARWWGPRGFTNPVCETEAREGGAWRIVMRAPDGAEYPCHGVYREIVAPELLVFTNIATDKEGNSILDGLTSVTFADVDGQTRLTLETRATAIVPGAVVYLSGMDAGWGQSLDRLEQLVLS